MKNKLFVFLVLALAAVTVFSSWKAFTAIKEGEAALARLEQVRLSLDKLERERDALKLELNREKNTRAELLQAKTDLEKQLAGATRSLFEQKESFVRLEDKLVRLESQRDDLNERLIALSDEKERLESNLNSVAKLKQALKSLKEKISREKKEARRRLDESESARGNRGYLVKNGASTYNLLDKKISVIPLQ